MTLPVGPGSYTVLAKSSQRFRARSPHLESQDGRSASEQAIDGHAALAGDEPFAIVCKSPAPACRVNLHGDHSVPMIRLSVATPAVFEWLIFALPLWSLPWLIGDGSIDPFFHRLATSFPHSFSLAEQWRSTRSLFGRRGI